MTRWQRPPSAVAIEVRGQEEPSWIEGPSGDDPILCLHNEGGFGRCEVAVKEVIAWARAHRPDLLREVPR